MGIILACGVFIASQSIEGTVVPVRRCFNVLTTFFGRQQRCFNVKTTSSAYWGGSRVFPLLTNDKTMCTSK